MASQKYCRHWYFIKCRSMRSAPGPRRLNSLHKQSVFTIRDESFELQSPQAITVLDELLRSGTCEIVRRELQELVEPDEGTRRLVTSMTYDRTVRRFHCVCPDTVVASANLNRSLALTI
jgi:hypothetical protein